MKHVVKHKHICLYMMLLIVIWTTFYLTVYLFKLCTQNNTYIFQGLTNLHTLLSGSYGRLRGSGHTVGLPLTRRLSGWCQSHPFCVPQCLWARYWTPNFTCGWAVSVWLMCVGESVSHICTTWMFVWMGEWQNYRRFTSNPKPERGNRSDNLN